MKLRNTFIIFIVSGFWHGANWTYIVWGGINAIYFLPLLLTKSNRTNMDIVAQGKMLPSLREFLGIITTFSLTVIGWIFFRAESIKHAMNYMKKLFSKSLFSVPNLSGKNVDVLILIVLIVFFILLEWVGRNGKFALEQLKNKSYRVITWAFYFFIIILVFIFQGKEQNFIYFQF